MFCEPTKALGTQQNTPDHYLDLLKFCLQYVASNAK